MKKLLLTAALSIAATVAITACAVQEPVDINSMSLEKTSPFETPTPKAYGENAGLYRETQMGMPAMIPHAINNFKITRENNPCIMCHGNQAKIGAAKVKGEATAMPATHWTKVDGQACRVCLAPRMSAVPRHSGRRTAARGNCPLKFDLR